MFLSAWAPMYLGALCMAEGKYEDAARHLEEARNLAEKVRWPTSLRYEMSLRAELHILEGRPEDAVALLEPLAEASEHDWVYATVLLTTLAWGRLETGDEKEAEKLADRATEEAARMKNWVDMVGVLRVKGMALARQSREEEASAAFEEALSLARSMPYPYAEARVLREYGTLHVHKEAIDLARKDLSAALGIFRRLGAGRDVEEVERALGAIGLRKA